MEEQTTLETIEAISAEVDKLDGALDRLLSDKKVLELELDNAEKDKEDLKVTIAQAYQDIRDIKEKITKLLLEKK